jgi:hypothetical protein
VTLLEIYPEKQCPEAAEFCRLFLHKTTGLSYVLDRNDYAVSIAECVDLDGLWKMPEQVLAMRDDYHVYLRRYTEGMHKTVMSFIPKHNYIKFGLM